MLNDFIIKSHVEKALLEDIGFSDITTDNLVSETDILEGALNTRAEGIFCGKRIFEIVFEILSKNISIEFFVKDGDKITKNSTLARFKGSAKAILTGERTALNYIQRLSGIATETFKYRQAILPYKAKISDTRKTTPNFRIFEKYAVKIGGGCVHRFNLADCVMIKDNHIKFAGSLTLAVDKIRKSISHTHKIEVECDTLEQVKEALDCNVDIIMLDNMTLENMKTACDLINHKAIIEASGNVKLETVNEIAKTGVDIISTSAIVANAPTLDLGFDM